MIDQLKLDIKNYLIDKYENLYDMTINFVVEEPKKKKLGDISIPVFVISKAVKKPLPVCSEELKEVLETSTLNPFFDKIQLMGGFLNIFVQRSTVVDHTLTKLKEGNYGENNIGNSKVICIDYSSPNIAKKFSVGHLRSTIIGHSIGRILEKCGYQVVKINHLGDFGTQFGKVIYAYLNWGEEEKVIADPIAELTSLYVKFHQEAEKNKTLDDEAREIFKELEKGNEKYVKIWKWFKEESLKAYKEMYELLQVDFDSYHGEAFYNDKMDDVVLELEEKGLLVEDNGAQVVWLDDNMPPALIKKQDGSTLYITRDLAAVFYRMYTYDFDECLYVVGNEQQLHFKMLSKVVEKMGYDYAKDIKHIGFGLVLSGGKKMSTRRGKVIKLIDVINDAITMSYNHIVEKNPTLENKESVAKSVGVSAVIFNDLKNYRTNDFEFDLEGMLNFGGQTGPYLQYTSVRINSILNSVDFNINNEIDSCLFDQDHYFEIIKELSQYQQVIKRSATEYAPSILAKYLLNLASLFNSFYAKEKIVVDNELEKNTKLLLIYYVRELINDGMNLLGMQVIEKM